MGGSRHRRCQQLTETTNYKLQKPAKNDKISPESIAKNADITDEALTAKANATLDNVQSATMAEKIKNAFDVHLDPSDIGADQIGAAAAVLKNLTTHEADAVKHITAAERTAWTSKANKDLSNVTNATFQQRVAAVLPKLMILRGDFYAGEYIGSGEAVRPIQLLFTPKLVFVAYFGATGFSFYSNETFYGYLATPDMPGIYGGDGYAYSYEILKIIENGFVVNNSQDSGRRVRLNEKGFRYRYFAIG